MPTAVSLSLMVLSQHLGVLLHPQGSREELVVAAALGHAVLYLGGLGGVGEGSCLLIHAHIPGQGLCDSRAPVLHQEIRNSLEFLHMQKAGDGPPQIFFSPAQGWSFAKRDFFPSPVTFLAAKENGTCSGSSQNSREQAVSNSPVCHALVRCFPTSLQHGQGAVMMLEPFPASWHLEGPVGQTAPSHDSWGAAGMVGVQPGEGVEMDGMEVPPWGFLALPK